MVIAFNSRDGRAMGWPAAGAGTVGAPRMATAWVLARHRHELEREYACIALGRGCGCLNAAGAHGFALALGPRACGGCG